MTSEPAESSRGLVSVGRVGRPHGRDGAFAVRGAEDAGERLADAAEVVVLRKDQPPVQHRIVSLRGTPAKPLLTLEGIDDRQAAANIVGAELALPAKRADDLGADEWYVRDLLGCRVTDGDRDIGRVQTVVELPSVDVLEVDRGSTAPLLLVPLNRDAVRSVDEKAGRIDVDMKFLGEGE